MKLKVLRANFYPPKYLRRVAKQVCELIQNSIIMQRYPREKAYFIGPDGIQFCIQENTEDVGSVVYVNEERPGLITLLVPMFSNHKLSPAFRVPPWLQPACGTCCSAAVVPFLAPLYFGQVSLADASKLFNVPVNFLEECFINEQDGYEDVDLLLPLSVTRAALNPDEAYVDIRGLIAWLTFFEHVNLDD